MKQIATTVLEMVNHLLQDHPELAPQVRLIAETAYGRNRSSRKYFGLNGLDQILERWLNYDHGYFVEMGANDGIVQSNTFYYERHRHWSGILVEPVPQNFLSCKKHRSAATKVFCAACVSFDYPEKFVEILYSNLMSTPVGLENDIEDPVAHAREGMQFLEPTEENFIFGALAVPLNRLLMESNAPRQMDLLSLDVEGGEIAVLKGLDHEAFRFRYLCIENRSFEKLSAYLTGIHYEFVEQLSSHDYLFADRS